MFRGPSPPQPVRHLVRAVRVFGHLPFCPLVTPLDLWARFLAQHHRIWANKRGARVGWLVGGVGVVINGGVGNHAGKIAIISTLAWPTFIMQLIDVVMMYIGLHGGERLRAIFFPVTYRRGLCKPIAPIIIIIIIRIQLVSDSNLHRYYLSEHQNNIILPIPLSLLPIPPLHAKQNWPRFHSCSQIWVHTAWAWRVMGVL